MSISPAVSTRAAAAVERAVDDRQREATEEVESILAAAVRVMERVAPEPPRVSDVVAEAGSSNKAARCRRCGRYLDSAQQHRPVDVEHLVRFCRRGVGAD